MRILAGAAIFNKEGKILLVQQTKSGRQPLRWGLPGGHAEGNENPEQTTIREIKEEVGLDIKLTNFVHAEILEVYDGSEYLLLTYKAETKNLDMTRIDSKEVNDYGWFDLEDIKRGKIKLRGNFLIKPITKAFSSTFGNLDSLSVYHYTKKEADGDSV